MASKYVKILILNMRTISRKKQKKQRKANTTLIIPNRVC